MKKKLQENCNFPFFGIFLLHWKQKWWNMIKNDKKMKKPEENCYFPFFVFFCTTGSKNDETCLKKWKNDKDKKMKKTRKIAIFHLLANYCTTGSKNDEKWKKNNDKNMIKNGKKNEENCNFPFSEKFLHQWKQKWWKMKKKKNNILKNEKW